MQSPTIIFDHVNKLVTIANGSPAAEKKMAEFAAQQQAQLATSGQPKQ
jgi:hypothetical protein